LFSAYNLRHAVSGILIAAVLGYGVSVHAAIDAPHNQCNNITCSSCHDLSLADSPLLAGSDINNFCTANCHSALTAPYTDTSAPIAKTHEDKICTDCHNPHIQGQKFWKNADGSDYFLAEGQIDSYTYNSGPKTTTINYSGGTFHSGWTVATITDKSSSQRRPILLPNIKKLGWSFPVTAMDATTITVKGNLTPVYTYTGTPTNFAIIMGQLLNQYIDTNDDGTKETEIKFFDHGGDCSWSYAYDESSTGTDPSPNGVCQACHTTTGHWKNDGTLADHFNTVMTCTHCHPHSNGFAYGYNADDPGCDDCHGHDNGFGGDTYYGTTQSHSSHMENDSDDLKGPGIGCSGCHDTDYFPYFADSETTLAATTVCDNCHSSGGAFDGVAMAKAGWDAGIYEADGTTLQSGKETWCAGCHDDQPAYSKQVPAEIIVDNLDPGASPAGAWNTSNGMPGYYGSNYHYHLTGAGTDKFTWTPAISTPGIYSVYGRWTQDPSRAPDATYTIYHDGGNTPVSVNQRANGGIWVFLGAFSFDGVNDKVELVQSANGYVIADAIKFETGPQATFAPNVVGDNSTYGFYVTGHNINCLECHDAAQTHIDGEHRTYKVNVNPYSNSYRLRTVNGQPAMILPRPLHPVNTNPLTHPEDFALCFSCHNKNDVLHATGAPGVTNFWNNDAAPGNSHNIHLMIYTNHFDSDWDGTADSSESCIACHNVHGAPNKVMVRHGELISTLGTTDKVPALNFAYLLPPSPGTRSAAATLEESIGGSLSFAGGAISQNKVCAACHSGINYLRTPYLGPRVISPAADPGTVDIGSGPVNTLFTAVILDHDSNVSSVTINLTAIGGSSTQAMYDNGTNGDEVSGDGVYSYLATVPGNTDPGTHAFTITATDPGASGTNVAALVVTVPGTIVLDNTDIGATPVGTWGTSSSISGYYGISYHYHTAAAGADTFTWTPTFTAAGTYEVFARWTQDPGRSPDATYTIYHDGGSTPIQKDQRSQGGTWVSLGTFAFDGENNDRIVLGQSANGYVIADSIKWELQP